MRWPMPAGAADRCQDMTVCSAFELKAKSNNPPDAAIWGKALWGEMVWTIKE